MTGLVFLVGGAFVEFWWPGVVVSVGSRWIASVTVVFFPLMPDGTDDNLVANDFEQNDAARAVEGNDQFAQAPIAEFGTSA